MNRTQKRQHRKMARTKAGKKGTGAQPDLPKVFLDEIIQNGVQAHRAAKLVEAEALYRRVLEMRPDHAEANHLLGLIAFQVGHNDQAIQLIKKAIRANPHKAEFQANLGPALQKKGRLDDAVASCNRAIALDPEYVEAHANLAGAFHAQGNLDDAVASYRQAIAIDPNFAEAHNNLGNTLKEQGQFEDALICYRQALSINPGDVEAHYNVGLALQEQGQFEDAMASYRKAIEINPDFAMAHYNLSNLCEKTSQLDKAYHHIGLALRDYPDHPGANVSLAILMRRRGEVGAAIKRLEILASRKLADSDAVRVHFELGKLYDLELDSAQAFKHFTLANAAQSREVGHKAGLQAEGYQRFVKNTATALKVEFVNSWSSVKAAAASETPVFLVGFPRSGTTLLDQILDGHKKIQVMEENPAMSAVRSRIEALPGGYPNALSDLKESDIKALRAIYKENVEQFFDRQSATILIDKLPLNIVNIPLILRLFPDARFILALRHPLDVVMSNFMQFFQLNDATSHFTTIVGTAALYGQIMRLWLQCADLLNLNFHITKYEDLVADIEGEARVLLGFLGVEWDKSVLDYRTHARQRGIINTPSYAQVTEPLYQRAKYRWIRYNEQLAPVVDDIAPLATIFGYSCKVNE